MCGLEMEFVSSGIWKLRLGTPERITPVSLQEKEILNEGLEKLPSAHYPPISEKEIQFKVTRRGCVIELPLDEKEQIFGFGLQFYSFNQRGLKKQIRVNSDPVADTGDTHAPVPFYVSTRGYGVLVDTARYVTFYCGSHSHSRLTPDAIESPNMIIEVPHVKGVDLYFFSGPTIINAVQRYVLFSGGGCIPPYWGLGVWYRTYALADQEIVHKHASYFRSTHIPCDVFGFEPGWHSHCYSCSYQWDLKKFPNPDRMIMNLNELNYKVNLWEHVFVHPTAPFWQEIRKYSGNYEVWGGLVPDFTTEARKIFADYHEKNFLSKGILGFKLDECDNSDYRPKPWSFPEVTEFPSGIDGEQMHSLLGVLYQRTIWSIFQKHNKRTFCQTRSSHALASPLPFVLYSDLYNHQDYIRALLNSGFSGLLWSPEVRNANSAEDLIRRIQTAVFSPLTLINAFQMKNPPWLQYDIEKNNEDILLENYKELEHIVRKLFELRMSLIPYLYSAFARYRFEGIPPVRALPLEYPDDANTYQIDDEYLLGDSLLVAPLFAGQQSRKVYLPNTAWYCFWTHQKYEGGKTYNVKADLERIPVFVRDGSLLPLARSLEFIKQDVCFEITVYIFGEKPAEFILFEDDGETYNFERGIYNLVKLVWDPKEGGKINRDGSYSGIRYKIIEWKRVAEDSL